MKENKKYIPIEQLESIKDACKVMYIESRTFQGPVQQQDRYLNTLVEETFKRSFDKLIQEDSDIAEGLEDCSKGFLNELNELMEEWKKGFELEVNKESNNFDNKQKNNWWQFWGK